MNDSSIASAVFMDTLVTIEVIKPASQDEFSERVNQAFTWFGHVEKNCSRFDETSEISALSAAPSGVPVKVSPLLFELTEFALAVARASDGAFDPTVGHALEMSGFNRNYLTGEQTRPRIDASAACSYRDVVLNREGSTVTLLRPLVLDLGAVAKGFAIDLAAAELSCFQNYAVNAGGDVRLRGRNSSNAPWSIGVRHPRQPQALIETLAISDAAVCTSGDYERPRPDGKPGHHILEPQTGQSAADVASVTVVAPTAMLADALSTAAFVLRPDRGLKLLEGQNVEGLIVSSGLELFATSGLSRYRP